MAFVMAFKTNLFLRLVRNLYAVRLINSSDLVEPF